MEDLVLKLTETEVQLVGNALGQQPFFMVETLILKIRGQVAAQVVTAEPEPEPAEPAGDATPTARRRSPA